MEWNCNGNKLIKTKDANGICSYLVVWIILHPFSIIDQRSKHNDAQQQKEHQQHQLFGGCPEGGTKRKIEEYEGEKGGCMAPERVEQNLQALRMLGELEESHYAVKFLIN